MSLPLKCIIIVFPDFIRLRKDAASIRAEVKVDILAHLLDCMNLIELAHNSIHTREEVQIYIFAAQLCGFSRSLSLFTSSQPFSTSGATDTPDILREIGLKHVAQAR